MTRAIEIELQRPNGQGQRRPLSGVGRPISATMIYVALFGGVACASLQLPAAEVAQFHASMRLAAEMGAATLPVQPGHCGAFGMSPAKEHLALARNQAEVATALAADGDARAVLLLARAQSDVDLAIALAREAAMAKRAAETAGILKAEARKDARVSEAPLSRIASSDTRISR